MSFNGQLHQNGFNSDPDISDSSKELFQSLKKICIPLLGNSRLQPQSAAKVASLLSELIHILESAEESGTHLRPSLISYTFFPLSTLLSRNEPINIPDHILERIFICLRLLFNNWWQNCEIEVWEQIVIFTSIILSGVDMKGKGKAKERDNETVESAVRLLLTLLRPSSLVGELSPTEDAARERLSLFRTRSHESRLVPFIGQALNSTLLTASSSHMPLQLVALELLKVIVEEYITDDIIPTILPGVVSSTTRISVATQGKQWVNGTVVAAALQVLEIIIIRAIGDAICIAAGIVKEFVELTELVELAGESVNDDLQFVSGTVGSEYRTSRTSSWLRATTSQLLMALNSLSPLISHPNPAALLSLSSLSHRILLETQLSFPQARPLMASFLLLLSSSQFESVSHRSRNYLVSLLAPTTSVRHAILQSLLQIATSNLATLPHLLSSRADVKVERVAVQVEAICNLAKPSNTTTNELPLPTVSTISNGIGKLLGPAGHIEKWGWSLLAVLEFEQPIISISTMNSSHLFLENALDGSDVFEFPDVVLKNSTSRSTLISLERMLQALGRAGGEDCLFSVEWFIGIGKNNINMNSVSALWCACRILEGIANTSLANSSQYTPLSRNARLEKFARWLSKAVSEFWDRRDADEDQFLSDANQGSVGDENEQLRVEYVKGLTPVQLHLNIKEPSTNVPRKNPDQSSSLHKSFLLQLLCISSSILRTKFTSLMLYTLYPILHSLVSTNQHLSSTAMTTLQHISNSTGYASSANLLLSNFDYALDSVSRRLTRRWLDIDAPKVLVLLIRLIGRDIVQRAGDVVEECFDRLDDFHGYQAIVEGLIEALYEVVKVVENEDPPPKDNRYQQPRQVQLNANDNKKVEEFLQWLKQRNSSPPIIDSAEDSFADPERSDRQKKESDAENESEQVEDVNEPDPLADPPETPIQTLTKQIVARSIYFLTHGSPMIRARILTLLGSAVPVLPESALLPSVHKAWPFVLNRFSDSEPFVISSAAFFVEALTTHVGSFMTTRIWDDVWPKFLKMLRDLDESDSKSALARRGTGAVGTESAYTISHRLYRSIIRTMTAAVKGVQVQESKSWDVMVAFRRFLHRGAHEELQECTRLLYLALGEINDDAVWLVLHSTLAGPDDPEYLVHLREPKWDIKQNAEFIMKILDESHIG